MPTRVKFVFIEAEGGDAVAKAMESIALMMRENADSISDQRVNESQYVGDGFPLPSGDDEDVSPS